MVQLYSSLSCMINEERYAILYFLRPSLDCSWLMKGGILNCSGEQTSVVTSTLKKRAEARDFTDKSEGRRDSARASTLLLRRGV